MVCDVAIVGAGAAGLATAIFLKRASPDLTVWLFDGAAKPGAKILVSGGGRCNVTNVSVSERDYNGGSAAFVRRVLKAFGSRETVALFAGLQVPLHQEAHGKLFPDSNRARDVLKALLDEASRLHVSVLAGCRVEAVRRQDDGFELATSRGMADATRVVLATGGESLPKSGSDGSGVAIARDLGLAIVPTTPALVPLVLDAADLLHSALSGVSHGVALSLRVNGKVTVRITGSMLWTHFGVSGPVVLDISRHWLRAAADGRDAALFANFCPGRRFDDVDSAVREMAQGRPRTSLHTTTAAFVPSAMATALLDAAGLPRDRALAHMTREQRHRLAHALTEWRLPVVAAKGYQAAETTAGGIALGELSAATLEAARVPGLYVVGEVMDVDGRIGGFSFQWAWSTAYVAAGAIARAVRANGAVARASVNREPA